MRTLITAAIAGTAVMALALVPCNTASAATVATAAAGVNLIPNIGITNTTALAFGQFVASAAAGTVVSDPISGVLTTTGGVVLGNHPGTSSSTFVVTGYANSTYSITIPPSATLTSGANTMTVSSLSSIVALGPLPGTTGTLSVGGAQTFFVTGTLIVGANQPVGIYSGTYNATVAYN